MHAKQERIDSLNYSNDTVFLARVFVCFAIKHVVLFIEVAPVSMPYCLPFLLASVNQIS